MFSRIALQILLGIWVAWHLAFGLLATFLPDTGARLSGWSPEGGWNGDMLALSTQYGMVMLLLALVYAIALVDPVRYIRMLWVAIAEQAFGIAYAVYIYFGIGNVTLGQVGIQSVINVAVIALLVTFWSKRRAGAVQDPA
jgi:hypothetical protein